MRARHTLSLLIVLAALGCGESHTPGTGEDGGPPLPGPDGSAGVCCPIADSSSGCWSPGALPAGGWAASAGECRATVPGDRPLTRQLDSHGCPILLDDPTGCCGCTSDGGLPPPPSDCDGLAPAACLAAGCAPDFDDACCSTCDPTGGCADCVNYQYHSCQPYEAACLGGPSCGVTPAWSCGPVAPQCDGAHAVDVDSCDRVGCVPAYPSSEGDPDPATATCVPIQATSCTIACRRVAPPCPTGTTAEGDGFCYTDRCIPSFVCG